MKEAIIISIENLTNSEKTQIPTYTTDHVSKLKKRENGEEARLKNQEIYGIENNFNIYPNYYKHK